MCIFMLGKALEVVGMPLSSKVRCFCYNTKPPPPREYLPPRPPPSYLPRDFLPPRAGGGGAQPYLLQALGPADPSPTHHQTTASVAEGDFQGQGSGAAAHVGKPADGGAVVPPPSQLARVTDGHASKWAEPVVCDGMEGALAYYNSLPPYIFRGVRGKGAASGLAEAVRYGSAIAAADKAGGATRTLLVLLTPGQGIDASAARAALGAARQTCPLSVVTLGVGDGPFHELGRIAAASPENTCAVDFHSTIDTKFPDRSLAVELLRALPEQEEISTLHP